MQNDKKELVDLYIPRRCFATNRLLNAKDYSSVQVSIKTAGIKEEQSKPEKMNDNLTMVLSGFVRSKGNSDAALNKYLKSKGILSFC